MITKNIENFYIQVNQYTNILTYKNLISDCAIFLDSKGGTAFPTCFICDVLGP